MSCPTCGGAQHCPCASCADRNAGRIVWRWLEDGERIACGHCGHTMHVDAWLAYDYRVMKAQIAAIEQRMAAGESA